MAPILKISPPVTDEELNELFASAWPEHQFTKMRALIERALFYVCACENDKLIGFSKVVSDGGRHGFLLDPTVAPEWRRKGIGKQLVAACAEEARRRGIEWLHVDFEPQLKPFYAACGFRHTEAGLLNLNANDRIKASFPGTDL